MKNIHRLIAADTLADLGNRIVIFTLLDLLFFKDANGLSNLMIMCVFDQLPSFLLSPFAGMLIDVFSAKALILLVLACKIIVTAGFCLTFSQIGTLSLYFFFVVTMVFFNIGRQSLTPMIVPRKQLIHYNSLNEKIAIFGGILAPFIIGKLILKAGRIPSLILACLIFLTAMVCTAGITISCFKKKKTDLAPGLKIRKRVFLQIFSDYSALFQSHRHLRPHFIILGFMLACGGLLNIGLPFLFKTKLQGNIAQWGVIISCFQAGSFAATFVLPKSVKYIRHYSHCSFIFPFLGLAMLLIACSPGYICIAVLMLFLGCGFTFIHLFLESLIQQNSAERHMGKIMSILSSYRGMCYLLSIVSGILVLKICSTDTLMQAGALILMIAFFITKKKSFTFKHIIFYKCLHERLSGKNPL